MVTVQQLEHAAHTHFSQSLPTRGGGEERQPPKVQTCFLHREEAGTRFLPVQDGFRFSPDFVQPPHRLPRMPPPQVPGPHSTGWFASGDTVTSQSQNPFLEVNGPRK